MRAKKALLNITWGFIYEAVSLVCGFIIPRLVLTSFGSEYNGVTNAIRQFLQIITLFQAGIGSVTMAALFRPLAEKDIVQVSVIVKTTENYLRKVVLIFLGLIIVIACGYPFLVIDEFDWFFTASLVIIMSLSTCAQFFFGQTYQLLLGADQNQRLTSIVNCFKTIANTLISALMIKMGFGIREVMLAAASVYIIAPLFVSTYTKKKYKIIRDVRKDTSVISQRWDNFGRQVAYFVISNTDLVVLSFFSTVYEISVYTIYRMIINGVFGIFKPLTLGVNAAFGNMLAKDEHTLLQKNLRIYEQIVFSAATLLYTVVAVMALPFISLYTSDITDANYYRPTFLLIFTVSAMFNCFRYPYEGLTIAAGHFRQTRNPAFIEAIINIIISIALVPNLGIIGIAIGTLVAYVFRTIYFSVYVSQKLIQRSFFILVKRLVLSIGCTAFICVVFTVIPLRETTNFLVWIGNAVIVTITTLVLIIFVEAVFYRSDLASFISMVRGALKKDSR